MPAALEALAEMKIYSHYISSVIKYWHEQNMCEVGCNVCYNSYLLVVNLRVVDYHKALDCCWLSSLEGGILDCDYVWVFIFQSCEKVLKDVPTACTIVLNKIYSLQVFWVYWSLGHD